MRFKHMNCVFKRNVSVSPILGVSKRAKLNKAMSLDEFVFRQEVLKVYRSILKACHKSHEKYDLIKYAREEFKMQNKEKDLGYRKFLLSDGITKANQTTQLMGLSDISKIHSNE